MNNNKIIDIKTQKIYDDIDAVAKDLGIDRDAIYCVLFNRGILRYKEYRGRFEYLDEYERRRKKWRETHPPIDISLL